MNAKKESVEQLLINQQELVAEEKWLRRMIDKLNTQTHALQVEQLHILNALNKKSNSNEPNEKAKNITTSAEKESSEAEELDLTVPSFHNRVESEEDDDEMEE